MITSILHSSLSELCRSLLNRETDMIHIRSPIAEPNASFIIWRGSRIDTNRYSTFAKIIQRYANSNNYFLDVYIPKNNIVPLTRTPKNNILFGHSAGGLNVLQHSNDDHKTKITYGATCNTNKKLYFGLGHIDKQYVKKDTLVMIGMFDGYIRSLNLIDEIYRNQTLICLDECKHMCICDNGEKNNTLVQNMLGLSDFTTDKISKEIMMFKVAFACVDFLVNRNGVNFKHHEFDTNFVLRDYKSILDYDTNIVPISLQNIIEPDIEPKQVYHDRFLSFLFSKPSCKKIHIFRGNSISIVNNSYQRSPSMWIKLWNPTNRVINFDVLFQDLVDQIDHNSKLKFEQDHVCFTTLEWILKPSNHYKDKNGVLHVSNYIFRWNNYLYIRVFSVSQIFEWLLIDKFF